MTRGRRETNMRRREFLGIALGTAVGWPAPGHSQPRVYRIGVLSAAPRTVDLNVAFIDELRRSGFAEGQNLTILSEGYGKRADEFPTIAKQFAEAGVDAIVAISGALAIRAAQAA